MKEKLTLVKVGGKIVEDEPSLTRLLDDFLKLEGHKVLVHGGGRTATDLATRLGVETKMINGRRITDDEMLRIVTMVYGGLVNKHIVALLAARGEHALGLTGADFDVIRSHRRPIQNGIDYGYAGDVDRVNGEWLARIVNQGILPVMAPLTHDGKGSMLNTNADTIAYETAKALAPFFSVSLVYCFEKPGVLANPDDDNSVIPTITSVDFPRLTEEGVISGGMLPKLHNAFAAIRAGVDRVIITQTTDLEGTNGTKLIEN